MQVREPSRETVRRLAELRVDDGRVLSVYINLDPSRFGTGPARSTAIRSVIDEAARRAREVDGELSHEARTALVCLRNASGADPHAALRVYGEHVLPALTGARV